MSLQRSIAHALAEACLSLPGGEMSFTFTAEDHLPMVRRYGEEEHVVVTVTVVKPDNPTGFGSLYAHDP
jgi:hypothetical protein